MRNANLVDILGLLPYEASMNRSVRCHLTYRHILQPDDECDNCICYGNSSWSSIFQSSASSNLHELNKHIGVLAKLVSHTHNPVPIPAPKVIIMI